MPRLRGLYFVVNSRPDIWLTLLAVLTPTKSTTVILPDLHEVLFPRSGNQVSECTDEHYTRLRDFVSARKGTLTRLGIPRMKNMEIRWYPLFF